MSEHDGPALSVVLATRDDGSIISTTLRALQAQSSAARIELVLVAAGPNRLHLKPEQLEGFWGHQTVALDGEWTIAQANGAGIRAARAEVVALAEDHSFPADGWADALLEAHRGPWAAVGPAIRNANPATAVSWADFAIGYAPWIEPVPPGPAPFLAGHNSSYKRSVLLEYGDRLEEMLQSEIVLHFDLTARGHQLYLESAAVTSHINFALLPVFLSLQYHAGRMFGGYRSESWSLWKRLFYGAASPLIPMVRLWRSVRSLRRRAKLPVPLLRLLPVLSIGLLIDGVGQMLGYLTGPGQSASRLAGLEFDRLAHVPETDLLELAERFGTPRPARAAG